MQIYSQLLNKAIAPRKIILLSSLVTIKNSTFSNDTNSTRCKKGKPKKRDPSDYDWHSNAEMPESVKVFLNNMTVDFDNKISAPK
ncbi:MAG: hypothetical protein ACI9XO_003488 [Paraglaciecola sp.]